MDGLKPTFSTDADHTEKLLAAAIRWWEARRPVSWYEADHLRNPTINCNGLHESNLAERVAVCVAEKWR